MKICLVFTYMSTSKVTTLLCGDGCTSMCLVSPKVIEWCHIVVFSPLEKRILLTELNKLHKDFSGEFAPVIIIVIRFLEYREYSFRLSVCPGLFRFKYCCPVRELFSLEILHVRFHKQLVKSVFSDTPTHKHNWMSCLRVNLQAVSNCHTPKVKGRKNKCTRQASKCDRS